ncbi:MAG: glycosyltransferase family 9 protein [Flavisolibacter sp.]
MLTSNESALYESALNIPSKKWSRSEPPTRILAIRLQAMGDLVITLPYLQRLRKTLAPNARLDLLTRKEVDPIPKDLELFDHVYSIGGGRNWKKQFILTCLLLPKLFLRRYDVVIDLQNNIISKTVRKALMPAAWSEFDRYSPVPAGECTRLTIEASGISCSKADSRFRLKSFTLKLPDILEENGWDPKNHLVLLNPAGAFPSRNWPLENYVQFARLWKRTFPGTQFLMVGTEFIAKKAEYLKSQLGDSCINLVGKTTPSEAFALVQKLQFALSEDSGLMHMAWVSGIPTLALFGSTTGIRATPLGKYSYTLGTSSLLPGQTQVTTCFDTIHDSISSYSALFVHNKALELIHSLEQQTKTSVFISNVETLKPR